MGTQTIQQLLDEKKQLNSDISSIQDMLGMLTMSATVRADLNKLIQTKQQRIEAIDKIFGETSVGVI